MGFLREGNKLTPSVVKGFYKSRVLSPTTTVVLGFASLPPKFFAAINIALPDLYIHAGGGGGGAASEGGGGGSLEGGCGSLDDCPGGWVPPCW